MKEPDDYANKWLIGLRKEDYNKPKSNDVLHYRWHSVADFLHKVRSHNHSSKHGHQRKLQAQVVYQVSVSN